MDRWIAWAGPLAAAALIAMMGFGVLKARGQEHRHGHHQHHADYQGWFNKAGEGCCNNQDCAPLADADERTTGGMLEVKVDGEWCPVLAKHYLSRGNVPDASTAHACAWLPHAKPDLTPCQRLLCYQPKPGI